MAKLIPQIPKKCPYSERLIYRKMDEDLPDEWIAIHSLHLTDHPYKMWGESDIVVISTKGVFVFEVKGGKVSCEDGFWVVRDPGGTELYRRQESPWEQACSASTAIKNTLYSDERFRGCLVGSGVCIPFDSVLMESAEINQEVLWDRRNEQRGDNFGFYLGQVADFWEKRLQKSEKTGGRPPRPITRPDLAEIRKLLRPDVDSHFSLGSYLNAIETQLIDLTAQQRKSLDGTSRNPRTLVMGTAGTGKTILAVERARKYAAEEKSVLLLCFNRLLARHLRENLSEEGGYVEVANLHSFYGELISRAGNRHLLDDTAVDPLEFYGLLMPSVFIESALALDYRAYDALIVDEAQDILTPAHLDALDLLLKDGLSRGSWHFFHDPNQNIYGTLAEKAEARLKDIGFADYELSVNCRNTQPIAVEANIITGFPISMNDAIDGPNPVIKFGASDAGLRKKITEEIRVLLDGDVEAKDIVFLSPRRFENSILRHFDGICGYPIEDLSVSNPSGPHLAFCTIHAFKGLERKCVVITDLRDLDDDEAARLYYVGLTRATTQLLLFMQESERAAYNRKARDFGLRLSRSRTTSV